MTSSAGASPALMMQARVINVNMVNWTVDVISQFDRHWFSDIQVASPYLHYNNGEGIYVMPEVGAVCMVCVPSDSSPPFISCFVGPMESNAADQLQNPASPDDSVLTTVFGTDQANPDDTTGSDAPQGTRSRGGQVPNPNTDATFASGRPAYNPGDIVMRTRDGNFLVLHRGGVVSIGATELAQRIYIPLGNKILDVSGDYEHQNIGGTIKWGIQQGPLVQNPATQEMETYRIFANDQYASLRIAKGKVLNPLAESGSSGDDVQTYGIGTDSKNPICYEIAITQGNGTKGFKGVTGAPSDSSVANSLVFHFFQDLKGNMLMRMAGSAVFSFGQRLKISVAQDFVVRAQTLDMLASDSASMGGTKLTGITGDLVEFSAGEGLPAARQGDAVTITMNGVTLTGVFNIAGPNPVSGTGTLTILTAVPAPGGVITTGNPNIHM